MQSYSLTANYPLPRYLLKGVHSMELLNKIRSIRKAATSAAHTTDTNTKSPIYDRIEQQKVLSRIESELDPMYSLFWRVSIATGWRTSDCLELEFNNVNFDTGIASIVVNKQTRAAEARAFNKVLLDWKQQLKKDAALQGDAKRHMVVDTCDHVNIQSLMTVEQVNKLGVDLQAAVNNAPVKRDSKKLPKVVLDMIKDRMNKNHHDEFIFSRSLSSSNRAVNESGHITRQAVWKGLQAVFTWFKAEINGALKLSAYSTRKTFAYRMLRGITGKDNNIAEVMQAFGHSSIQITFKYLGLASKADELQAAMVEV